ncbi:MAG TPA: thiol-disulfide oxidoreductase [Flavobacteriales bacterium]|nr:DCC1-like thiol-disulfide oxidoreductase family protein [Salibacteraceae bacterium]HAS34839.1 thiol-disulfide oxidoreductase [Flavobacteriales bacterium]
MTFKRIVFFDGHCQLCNRFLNFLILLDRKRNLHFASLQGKTSQEILSEEERSLHDSLIFWEEGKLTYKSYAALKAVASLGGVWKGVLMFRLVPSSLLDAFYDLVARNRFKWFGRRESCRMPTKEEAKYLLP